MYLAAQVLRLARLLILEKISHQCIIKGALVFGTKEYMTIVYPLTLCD